MTVETTISQTQTVAAADAGWSLPLAFTQFNPLLGTLVDVQIGITTDINGSASIENLGATAAGLSVELHGTIDLAGPDGTQLASNATMATGLVDLGAYDGTSDFAGNAGTILSGITNTASSTVIYAPGTADLVAFVGTGTLDLTATGSAGSDNVGYGNLLTLTQAQVGATVTVQYDYLSPGSVAGTDVTTSEAGTPDVNSPGPAGPDTVQPPTASIANAQTTVAQTLILADATTGWNTDVTARQFNPTMGTLVAVDLTLVGDINGSVAVENLGSGAVSASTIDFANIAMTLPGSLGVMQTAPLISNTVSLGAFDGTIDFAGTSGSTASGLTQTGSATSQFDSATTDLSSFIGIGTVGLALNAYSPSTSSGSADLESKLLTAAGAEVMVSYVYVPSSSTSGIVASPSISGTTADLETSDHATILPFYGVTITDRNVDQTETVTVTQSDTANGTLSNLDGGIYNATLGAYTISGSTANVTSAIDGLVFTPTQGQVGLGQSVTTGFTITDIDSAGASTSDSTTSVVATAGPGAFIVLDTSNGALSTQAGQPYSGPVAGLQYQCIDISTDSLNITSLVPNAFLRSGSGMDGLNVSQANGNNIMDGGTGSNFLTGGTGDDTFYLDDRIPTTPVFSTIVNFHAGDNVTVWGINPTDFSTLVVDDQGAPGYTGVDLIFTRPDQPPVSFVLDGYTSADLTNGRLSSSYGMTPDLPGLPGSQYLTIHGN